MGVWASSSLSDFLMFSPTVYFRLYELNNAALWPLQLVMIAAALVLLMLSLRTEVGSWNIAALLLGLIWGVVAWGFFYQRYGQINLTAPWFAIAFGAEALLLFLAGIAGIKGFGRGDWYSTTAFHPGLILFFYALVFHPIIGLLFGRSWNSVELFGVTPDPTALGTLGILLMRRGVITWLLAVIPIFWCLVSGLTYMAMEIPYGLITPAVALIAILVAILLHQNRHRYFHSI